MKKEKGKECYNGGKKHNFKPRYGEKERIGTFNLHNCNMEQARDFLTLKVYEKDVCVWCGETIEK